MRRIVRGLGVGLLAYLLCWIGASAWLDSESKQYQHNEIAWVYSVDVLGGANNQLDMLPKNLRGPTRKGEQYPLPKNLKIPPEHKSVFVWDLCIDAVQVRYSAKTLDKVARLNTENAMAVFDDLGRYQAAQSAQNE